MIRKAKKEDIAEVTSIYNAILSEEKNGTVYTNWQEGLYPTAATAEQGVAQGTMFVGENESGEIYGSVILNSFQPSEYANINWKIKAKAERVLVIHTLTIAPWHSGKGKGREFVDFIEEFAGKNKFEAIRLDTYEGNLPAARLYTKLGYAYAGSTEFNFQNVIKETLKCFEKAVTAVTNEKKKDGKEGTTMVDGIEKVKENHNKGYNCAQAVACAYCESFGMDEKTAFRAMESFGGGMAMLSTCGAVSAMAFIAGLKNSDGNLDAPASKQATYKEMRAMAGEFKEKNQSILCRELKGIDTGVVLRSCKGCMEDCGEIIEKYLIEK